MQQGGRVVLKSKREIQRMHGAGQHTAEILEEMCQAVAPGVTTWDLDALARKQIARRNLQSSFLGYNGFPAVVCISVNEELVHGIPRQDKVLHAGDIVSIDFGVTYKGYVGDAPRTVPVMHTHVAAERLVDATRTSLDKAIALCTPEHRLSDIGRVVQSHIEPLGYGIVRDWGGHGIGTAMHEDPRVPNYYDGPKPRMRPGLVIAVEPMVNMGGYGVELMADGWTVLTKDRTWSAHVEDTIAITEHGPWVLTRL